MAGASLVAALRPGVAPSLREGARLCAVPAAFDALVREHEAALAAFARRLCGSAADGDDLVQDCLERALRRFDSFAPGTHGRAWLFTILHHAFIDRCRRRAAEKRVDGVDTSEVVAPEPAEPPVWASVTAEQFARAIDQLDQDFRSVYRLHAEGRSYQDISAALGIPVVTVGTRLNRARSKLRRLLESALAAEEQS